MRMQLHSQDLQACLGQSGFQLGGASLPISKLLEIPNPMSHACQEPADEQVAEKISHQSYPDKYRKSEQLGLRAVDEFDDGEIHHQLCQGENDPRADVHGEP